MFLEPTLGDHISSRVAKEAGLAVNQDDIEGRGINAGRVHHSLKFRPLVVASAGTCIDEFADHEPATLAATAAGLRQLVGNRNVVFRLPRGRNACVDRDPLAHSGLSSLSLAARLARSSNNSANTSISV